MIADKEIIQRIKSSLLIIKIEDMKNIEISTKKKEQNNMTKFFFNLIPLDETRHLFRNLKTLYIYVDYFIMYNNFCYEIKEEEKVNSMIRLKTF